MSKGNRNLDGHVNDKKKRILIIGQHSYIGESFQKYAEKFYSQDFEINTISARDELWKNIDFSYYDCVLNVTGIAHITENKSNRCLYYKVNRDLAIDLAIKAKKEGVHQFIVLSSMSVYGIVSGHITKETIPKPTNAYGKSKLQADNLLQRIEDDFFKVVILRPPMVYGKNCKGNYKTLRKFALHFPVFPSISNQRSLIYIGNLCEFICGIIKKDCSGIFFPQNKDYVSTSDMVKTIARLHGKKRIFVSFFNPIIKIIPTKIFKKVFGNLTYEKIDVIDKFDFVESIRLSEKQGKWYNEK